MHSAIDQDAALDVFNVGEGTIDDGHLLLRIKQDLGPNWVTVQLDLEPSVKPFRLAFQGTIGSNMNDIYSTFALDNVRLTPGACNSPASCTFEHDLCSWYANEKLGDMEWQLAAPGELTLATRPYWDSTLRNNLGGFVFIEADQNLVGNRAWLMSERLSPIISAERCLTFWYHIYGAEGTKLSVLMYGSDHGVISVLWKLAQLTTSWDPGWLYAMAPFSSSLSHQVVIEAVLGSGFLGDVAVDDVVVASGGCAIHPPEANDGVNYTTPVRPTPEPTTTGPPGIYDCSFDEDLCLWTSDSGPNTGNELEWRVHPADESSYGGYAYLHITGEVFQGARGVLNSSQISATHASCFTFSYILEGPHALHILQQHEKNLLLVWSLDGPVGGSWMSGQVTVSSDDIFNILVEGVRGNTADGIIAIDSITLAPGPCVIPEQSCTFENDGMCGWQPSGNPGPGDPAWIWSDGHTTTLDHTTTTVNGHMLIANNNWNSSVLNFAVVSSTLYSSQGATCIRFFYYAPEGTAATLKMFYVEDDVIGDVINLAPVILWSEPVGQVSQWMEGHADINVNFFRIQLHAVFDAQDNTSYIAFDDFSIRFGTCGNSAECNFDGLHLCGWSHSPTEKAYWDIVRGTEHTYGELESFKILIILRLIQNQRYFVLIDKLSTTKNTDYPFLRCYVDPIHDVKYCHNWYKGSVWCGACCTVCRAVCHVLCRAVCHVLCRAVCDVLCRAVCRAVCTYLTTCHQYITYHTPQPIGEPRVLVWSISSVQPGPWSVGRVPLHGVTDGYFLIHLEGIVGYNQQERIHVDDLLTFTGKCSIWPEAARPNNNTEMTTTTPGGSTTTQEPLGENDCNFEDMMMPFCTWRMSENNGTVPWIRWSGPPDTTSPGPSTDHTYGTDSGHYLYVEAQWSSSPAAAILYQGGVSDAQCLRFWYYMFGEKTPDLIATTEENGSINQPIFIRAGSQGDSWHPTSVDIQINAVKYNVVIRAVWDESRQGIIAIDDLRLHPGCCAHYPDDPDVVHDFEENGSMFQEVDGSQIDWDTKSVQEQPDHTLGTLKGHIARADLSTHNVGDRGQIISPLYKNPGNTYQCVHFYYYLSGLSGTAKLLAYTRSSEDGSGVSLDMPKQEIFEVTESQGDQWVHAQRRYSEQGNFQLIFEAKVLKNKTKAVVGIDDIYTTTDDCEMYGHCEFEHDLCSYTNSQTDSNDWLLQSPTDALPGPPVDHSTDSSRGHYVILSGYLLPDQGGYANLQSQQYSSYIDSGTCINFWYNAAFTNGSLTVSVARSNSWQTLWRLRQGTDPQWHFAQVTTKQDTFHRVIFTGMLDANPDAYIALDDVSIDRWGKCVGDYIRPSVADPTHQAEEDIACGFDTDTCRWTASDKLQVGTTDKVYADRNQGNYLYLQASQSNQEPYQATFLSQRLAINPQGAHDYCLRFWYYMFGSDTPWLTVQQRTLTNQWGNLTTTDVIWERIAGYVDLWHEASVEFFTDDGDCKLRMLVTVEADSKGTVAVDDMEALVGPCNMDPLNCDFESQGCVWKDDGNYPLEWSRVMAEEGAETMGYDHTTSTQIGHYLYPRVRNGLKEVPRGQMFGLLLGPDLNPGAGNQCLTFWYSIEGSSTLSLLKLGDFSEVLWNRTRSESFLWTLGRVDVITDIVLKLGFRADYPEEVGNAIVLDDVSLLPEQCPGNSVACDFDQDLCSWSNLVGSRLKWLVGRGFTSDPSVVSGLFTDHTTQDGLYAYVDFTTYVGNDKTAQLISQPIPPTTVSCLSFWYVKYGESSRSGVLSVLRSRVNGESDETLLKLDNTVSVREWNRVKLNVSSPEHSFCISFEAKMAAQDQFIAIDDVNFLPGDCTELPPTTTPPSQFVVCDFESDDLCGFEQQQDDNFDWTHGTGEDNPALPDDHTTGYTNGHYMYVDPTHQGSGAVASLASPVFYDLSEACVTLSYFTTDVVGQLQVWLHTEEDPEAILLGKFSAPFSTWTGVRIPVLAAGAWQVECRVVVDLGIGFIGIDDFTLNPGGCPDPVSCDFEGGTCLWQNVESDKWSNGHVTDDPSQAPGYGNAPPYDHTTGTPYGHYLYFYDAAPDAATATMLSEIFTTEKDACFSFWLHMFGDKVGRLQLKAIDAGGTIVLTTIEGSQGLRWQRIQVGIRNSPQQWLAFTVAGVTGRVNVVALDDLELYAGLCVDNSTLPDFRCDDGHTIPQNQVCNYNPECIHEEDERWCGTCDFSEDTCGWRSVETSEDNTHLWWRRLQAEIGIPEDPHISRMEVKEKEGLVFNQPRLLTRVLQPAHHTCTLLMDYILSALEEPGPKLNVYLEHGGSDLTILFRAQSHIEQWQTLELPVGRIPSSYRVLIEASSSGDPLEMIAVDEMEFSNCNSPPVCSELPAGYIMCENQACSPAEALCDFTDDCGDYTDEASCEDYPLRCTFEDDNLCGWRGTASFNLTQARDSRRPPFRDHTVNTADGYIVVVAADFPTTARIISPILLPSDGCQIRLYHAVSGATSTKLHIRVRSFENGAIISEVPLQSYEEEMFYWQRFSKSYSFEESFYFELEGEIQEWGSVGVDDISLTPACKENPATPKPPPFITTTKGPCDDGFFLCDEEYFVKTCIPNDQVCDFKTDCPGNNDERMCGTTTFERDAGGWQDVSDTVYSWSRVKAADAQYPNGTAPAFDHTSIGEGYYMWAPARLTDVPESTATMVTPVLVPPGLACTMILWYYCKDGQPTLTVSAWTADDLRVQITNKILQCSFNQKWRQGQIFIGEQNSHFTVEVKSTKFASYWSATQYDVAVDDITFSHCSTPDQPSNENIRCTFSEPCGLYQSHRDDMDWQVVTEHTNSFMVAFGDEENRTAILETSWRTASIGFCLSFRYVIVGQASCEILVRQHTKNETVWTRGGGGINFLDWHTQHLNLNSESEFQIWIIGHTGGDTESKVMIDDVDVMKGVCPASITCSFDDTTEDCRWENYYLSGASLPWDIGRGMDNISTAPTVDHSWGTVYGHYQYLNLQENQDGQFAHLKSPEIISTAPEGECFQFWFYLYSSKAGEDVGEVGVRLLLNATTVTERIWQHLYNGRPGWQYADTTIRNDKNFSVILEGRRLNGSQGFMAWDDLSVRRGACKAPGTCDFESGLCSWTDVPDPRDNNWVWLKAEAASDGVLTDHTTNSGLGHYVSFDLARCNYGSTCYADLVSSDITPQESRYCFYFYMNTLQSSRDKNSLTIEVVNVEENTSQLVATYSNIYDNTWTYFQQQLQNLNHVFHLRLRSTMLTDLLDVGAYTALDDLELLPGKCQSVINTTPSPSATPPPETQLTCTFEESTLCGWRQDLGDTRDWILSTGEIISSPLGPLVDHTTHLSGGHFIYSYSSGPPGTASLYSETLESKEDGNCLSFSYYMHGFAPPSLKLFILKAGEKPGATQIPDWDHFKEVGETWQQVRLFIPKREYDQYVTLEASTQPSNGDYGHTAIDDILLTEGSCQKLGDYTCDFETSDLCEWTSSHEQGLEWIWNSGRNPDLTNGPDIDHTFGSTEGHYVSLKHSSAMNDEKTYLTSPEHHSAGEMCLQFYYYMQGRDSWSGSLSVYVKAPSVDIEDINPVWSVTGARGDVWILARKQLSFVGDYQTVFSAVIGNEGDNSIIAVDDVVVYKKGCPAPATCTFEDGYCDWSNVHEGDKMDWVMNQGHTPTPNTGPHYDHTLQTVLGHYLYMEADSGEMSFTAILESPYISAGEYCFELYYYMFGKDVSGLVVEVEKNEEIKPVIQKVGDQGSEWKLGKASLSEDAVFKIRVKAQRGAGVEGDIAIDDTWTSKGLCHDNPDQFMCPDGTLIAQSQVCDFIVDCPDKDDEMLCGDCDFELGPCGWNFVLDNDYIWKRTQNLSDDVDSGNIYDHTTGTQEGYYLYVAKHASEHSGPALMLTLPHYNAHLDCTMNFCLQRSQRFFGYMYEVEVTANYECSFSDWVGEFIVQVDGQTSAAPSDLTIDDITFTGCSLPSSTEECPTYYMKCTETGICVPLEFVCDNTNDCGDLSDEHNCEAFFPLCSLEEDDLCDWSQESDDDNTDWMYGTGHTAEGGNTFLTGPPADHTLRLSAGHYMYVTSPTSYTSNDRKGKAIYRAWFVSPVLLADEENPLTCKLRFHYYMYGRNIEELNVYIRTELHGEKKLSFTRTGEQGQFWDRSIVSTITKMPFQFVIEGVTNNIGLSDIAIDDLSFTDSCRIVNITLPDGVTPKPPTNPCSDDQFYCTADDKCISDSMRCDWKNDCSDNADEEDCGACNFEYDMCSWSDTSEGIFHWRRIMANEISQYSHPSVDHTHHQSDGHYIYLEGADGIIDKTAVLTSPQLRHTTGYYCELHLWLFLDKGMNTHFAVYSHNSYQNTDHLLYNLTYSDIQEKTWYEILVPARLVPSTSYFKLTATPVFDQSIDWAESHSSLAIDDITFFNCIDGFLILDCDFDGARCNWRQDQSDQQDWMMSDANSNLLSDHTTGMGRYTYVCFDQQFAKKNDKARLISTVQSRPDGFKNIFTLWYYLYGGNAGTFRIVQMKQNLKENSTLFTVSGSQEDRWMLVERELETDDDYSIILEGEWEEVGRGMLAVDDVKLTSKLHSSLCDFEVDFCQWQQKTSDTQWVRGRGKENISSNPPLDHTYNSETGYYAFLKRKTDPGKVGFLTSPVYQFVGIQCLRFWYHILGENVGRLSVQVSDEAGTGGFVPVWSFEGNAFEMWSLGLVTLPSLQKYVVRFKGITGTNNASVIALDDVEFIPSVCPKAHECDFEYDWCDWMNANDGEDTFDWQRSSGSEGGGILVDHTINYETGHYMVAKLEGKKRGDSAKFFGSTVPAKLNCMTFWYSMQHIVNATLSVILLEGDGTPLIHLHNSTLDYLWEEITVNPEVLSDTFEVMFELLVEEDITSSEFVSVAIDDIAFTTNCKIPTFSPPLTTPVPTHLPTIYDCDFEQEDALTCGWTQNTDDGLDWQRWQGRVPATETGPSTDHTLLTDDGHYIYVSTTNKTERTATLISPLIGTGVSGACLSFWYHMFGFDIGSLRLQLVGTNSVDLVWQRSHEQGDDWLQAEVHLTNAAPSYITLEATPNSFGKGVIALDDITLTFGMCRTTKLCDFESGNVCHFEQSIEDDLDWELVLVSSSNTRNEKHPDGDHSLQSSLGHYLKLSGQGLATIFTNEIHPQYSCVEFWVYLDGFPGYSSSDLLVYTRRNGMLDQDPRINITNIIGHSWSRYLLPVISSIKYSLAFESHVRGSGYVVGLDDVQPLLTCEPMDECNFETDFCMWSNSVNEDQFDWSITTGKYLDNIYAPNVDVSLGSPYGKFAYVDTFRESFTEKEPQAILESNVMEQRKLCLSFWYHVQGNGQPSLTLSTKIMATDEILEVWKNPYVINAEWKFQQVSVEQSNRYKLQFMAESDDGNNGIIALDQVKTIPGECTNSTVPDCSLTCDMGNTCIHEYQICNFIQECVDGRDERFCGYNCTFDENPVDEPYCGWSNNMTDGGILSWLPLTGQFNNSYGPPLDHTTLTQSGHYMAVAPVDGSTRGETPAVLQSPALHNSAGYCQMTFWYVMYGKPDNLSSTFIGTLTAFYQTADISTELLRLVGNHGDEWIHGVVYIGRIKPEFNVRFEGDRNLDISGYIAVDDIKFDNCFLPTPNKNPGECKEFTCSNEACVSMFDRCDFVDNCGDYSDEIDETAGCDKFIGRCSFEDSSFCDWLQEGPNYWQLGSPISDDIIPKRDHTVNTVSGSFIYIDNSGSNDNDTTATLASSVITRKDTFTDACILQFFYYMDGPAVSKLVVSTRDASNGPLVDHLIISGAVGPYWERADIFVEPQEVMTRPLQFVITGETNDYLGAEASVIAVDDLSFTEACALSSNPLPTLQPIPSTTTLEPCSDQFQCEAGECIPLEYVCNFVDNCRNGADERICAECTFEDGVCGWHDESYGTYFWNRSNTGTEDRDEVMIVDKKLSGSSKTANLISSPLGSSAAACFMTFFYYIHGGQVGSTSLHLYLQTSNDNKYPIWFVLTDMNDTWHNETVGIGEHGSGWNLRFEANHYDTEGVIMIDEVHLMNCSLPSETLCTHDQTHCINGVCVNSNQLCDFSDDCGDRTDELPTLCEKYPERCDFEQDFCNWNSEIGDSEWSRKTGEMLSEDVGPGYDHTYGNQTGYYLYLKSGEGDAGKIGRLSSATFNPSSGLCHFRFWYMMRANQGATLTATVAETTKNLVRYPPKQIFQTSGTEEYLWVKVDVPINFPRYFKILFEGKVGNEGNGDIAVDDMSFSLDCRPSDTNSCSEGEYQCQSSQCIPFTKVCDFRFDCGDSSDELPCPSYCNFEVDSCGWQETIDDQLNWVLAKADDSSFGTDSGGPYVDETGNKDGHFLLLHSTSDNLIDDEGNALTHWYQNSAPSCHFKYWYYMKGVLGSNVVLRFNSTPDDFTNLTFFSGDFETGNEQWVNGEVGIGRQEHPFQLSLYKESAEDYFGKFAIDETEFDQNCHYPQPSENECASHEFHCFHTMVCILNEKVCDLNDDCGAREDEALPICYGHHFLTLEDDRWQGWFSQGQDDIEDDFDWTLWSGSTYTLGTGPNFDHTSSSHRGHYFYLETSHPQRYNEKAWLVSYPIMAGPNCIFTFYSHMFGKDIGSLTVLVRNESESNMDKVLVLDGEMGNFWVKQTVTPDLLPQHQPFQLIIEGKVGVEELGDIAIDDFVFSPGCRLSGHPSRNCTSGEHRCAGGTCLPVKNRCNFVVDCPDGDDSDEEGCVQQKCTFEGQDLCNWEIKANEYSFLPDETAAALFRWKLIRGTDSLENEEQIPFRPNVDHTHGNSISYYAFTSASLGEYEAVTDLVTAITIGESSATCRLRMWYWLAGVKAGSLHLQLVSASGETTEVWMTDGNHGSKWNLVEVPLKHVFDQRVAVRAQRGITYVGGGAVDDIEFLECAPPTLPPDGMTCEEIQKFECRSGTCIDPDRVCDYSDDCLDLSDELETRCSSYNYRCNFESGLCDDWKQDLEDNANWVLQQASSDMIGSLPNYDHTYQNTRFSYYENGMLMLVQLDNSVQNLWLSVNLYIEDDSDYNDYQFLKTFCLSVEICETEDRPRNISALSFCPSDRRFSYYENGMLMLVQLDNSVQNLWLSVNLYIEDDSDYNDYQIVVEGSASQGEVGNLVLDDFSMTPGCERSPNQQLPGNDQTTPAPTCEQGQQPCSNGKCYYPSEACNFKDDCGDGTDELHCTKSCDFEEDDWCGWFESTANSIHWKHSGFPAVPPGPPTDHYNKNTTSDLISCKTEGQGGRVAILESHTFSSVSRECTLVFWYYMASGNSETSSFILFRKSEEDAVSGHPAESLWQGKQEPQDWIVESIKIGGKRDFTLHFKATHGPGKTHFALDDIRFESCAPSVNECVTSTDFKCNDSSCIPHQLVCDASYDCSDKSDEYKCPHVQGNCNFDSPFWLTECDYTQSTDDDTQWIQGISSGDPTTGPPHDHTLGSTGKYLYVSSTTGEPGKLATLKINNLYPASVGICYVRFWLYMHADLTLVAPSVDVGALRLYLQTKAAQRQLLISITGNHASSWLEKVVPINMDTSFFVLIEAETGSSTHTYIAIDDVSFTPECETGVGPPPVNGTCDPNELPCKSGQCIPEAFFCDCFVDCSDGSDEMSCSTTCSTVMTRSTTTTTLRPTTTTRNPCPCNAAEFSCMDDRCTCIPSLLLCDGISDCPNGGDEAKCPDKTPCDPGFFYCGEVFMVHHPCMLMSHVCDGKVQCFYYNADESVCGGCPDNYCQNDGICAAHSDGDAPACNCTSQYTGNRCELLAPPTSPPPPLDDDNLTPGEVAGIVLGVIFFIILLAILVFYINKRKQYPPVREESTWDDPRNQPYFGLDIPQSIDNAYPLQELNKSSTSTSDSSQNFLEDFDDTLAPDKPVSDL
ncbi:LOW QUALITY PROTEIN: MAM and LDL-receptor class A domain-containing protein 1-like [Panulirus ornatus]|uniref:LOW QUALITY PROTEIN: MAM and LDL-receptor class A domain-containing protein 1-like n=1 Tax=Panulirus ornatus TaxID=150431 RepID=UPI003A87735A